MPRSIVAANATEYAFGANAVPRRECHGVREYAFGANAVPWPAYRGIFNMRSASSTAFSTPCLPTPIVATGTPRGS